MRNAMYSMRSFARDLKISPQMLSHVLKGRRSLSPSLVKQIAVHLRLGPEEKRDFYFQYLEGQRPTLMEKPTESDKPTCSLPQESIAG